MSLFQTEVRMATRRLTADLRTWMRRALDYGWFDITSGDYDSGSGSRCPVSAAATMAGAWVDGGIVGRPEWGSSDEPAAEVEDFAAYFDLVAEDIGIYEALALVRRELDADVGGIAKAA